MDTLLNYFDLIWENIYLKGILFYVLYLVIYFMIVAPIAKLIFVKLTKKTQTNMDNEIYWKTRAYVRVLFALLWLNIVYNFYFSNFINENYVILYHLLVSIEIVILYIIFHKSISIILKYTTRKFPQTFTKNLSNLFKIIADIIIVSVFFLLILKVWWINITPLLASAGIFGLAVAMASKEIIENFLSWMILFADKTINVWDTIILSDGTVAVVDEINIRTTKLKTFDGNVVIIPNSDLLNDRIINKSLNEVTPYKRVVVTVWISYGDDTEKAKELLKSYLLDLDWIDKETAVVYVDALADWSVNITWKVMVEADKWSYLLEKQVLERVYKEFPKEWLNFPFPTYSIEKVN